MRYTLHFETSHSYDPMDEGGMTRQRWVDEYAEKNTQVTIYGDDGYWLEMDIKHSFAAADDREAQLYVAKYMEDEGDECWTVMQGRRYAFTEEDELITMEPAHAN